MHILALAGIRSLPFSTRYSFKRLMNSSALLLQPELGSTAACITAIVTHPTQPHNDAMTELHGNPTAHRSCLCTVAAHGGVLDCCGSQRAGGHAARSVSEELTQGQPMTLDAMMFDVLQRMDCNVAFKR